MIATDIADDGHWSNDSIKTYIADWIFEKDSLNQLQTFRTNVQDWGLSKTVPNFEKYVRNYWYYSYGLKECSTKGKVDKNSNEKSKRSSHYFICKDNKWQVALDIEQDIYQWADGKDGETKPGNVNKDRIYVFDSDHWRPANNEETVLGGCIEGKAGNVGVAHDEYYICRDREWVVATDIEKDTYHWEAGTDGQTKPGDVNNNLTYVYDSDHWRLANNDQEIEFGGCIEGRAGEVNNIGSQYYICRNREWVVASDLEKDTYGWNPGADGEIKKGNVNTTWTYVYDSDHWREANNIEAVLGGCVTAGVVDKIGSTYYMCPSNRSWRVATDLEKDTYGWETNCTEGAVRKGKVNTGKTYVCENSSWRLGDDMDYNIGTGCVTEGSYSPKRYNKYYYQCTKQSGSIPHVWKQTTEYYSDVADEQSKCNSSGPYKLGQIFNGYVSNKEYVCDNGAFRTVQNNESKLKQGCVSYIQNKYFTVDSANGYKSIYKCDYSNKKWVFDIDRNKGTLTDEHDKNYAGVYKTYGMIIIGKQTWVSEDMRYATHVDGNGNMTYDLGNNMGDYGYLYINAVASQVCPSGWHVATRSDWTTLINYADGVGNLLANEGSYSWSDASNTYGFSAHKNRVKVDGTPIYEDYASYRIGNEDFVIQLGKMGNNFVSSYSCCMGSSKVAIRCIKD
jgi:uncharacterized protein (TIGR02145 family)